MNCKALIQFQKVFWKKTPELQWIHNSGISLMLKQLWKEVVDMLLYLCGFKVTRQLKFVRGINIFD